MLSFFNILKFGNMAILDPDIRFKLSRYLCLGIQGGKNRQKDVPRGTELPVNYVFESFCVVGPLSHSYLGRLGLRLQGYIDLILNHLTLTTPTIIPASYIQNIWAFI